jgi:hypothetical protein
MTKQKITPRAPTPNGAPQIVLFGLDQDKKPRAGRFSARDAELAKKAAQAMSLEVCQVASPELTEIAVKLPMGRLHAQGRAFVPYVRQDLFAKLAEAAGKHGRVEASNPPTDQAASPAAGKADETPPITAALPRGWHDIAAGHMVLAHEGLADGWWECIVEERNGDMLKLRVRDYPKYKKFVQHVTAVALVYPPAPGI